MGVFRKRNRVQKSKEREQRANGDLLREWFQSRIADHAKAAEKRRKARAERVPDGTRGIDRVPSRLQGLGGMPQTLVENEDDNYASRRARAISRGLREEHPASREMRKPPKGKLQVRAGSNVPHVNPARDAKAGRRLRAELRG